MGAVKKKNVRKVQIHGGGQGAGPWGAGYDELKKKRFFTFFTLDYTPPLPS